MRTLTFSLVVCLAALAVMPANGALITYSDRTTWSDAVTGGTDITFNSLTSGTSYPSGLTLGPSGNDTKFTLVGSGWLWAVAGYGGPNTCVGICLYSETTGSVRGIESDFLSTMVTAFGLNIWTRNNTAQTVTVKVFYQGSLTPDYTTTVATIDHLQVPVFFGVTTDQIIDRVVFQTTDTGSTANGQVLIDNFSYGQSNGSGDPPPESSGEAPEGTTISYVAAGLVAVLSSRASQLRRMLAR